MLPPGASLAPYPGNPRRRDYATRRTFVLTSPGEAPRLLTIGRDLSLLRDRHQAFSQSLPALAAKPLLFKSTPERDYFLREFIEGKTIDELVGLGELTAEQALTHSAAVQRILEATTEPSDINAATGEARQVFQQLATISSINAFDHAVLRDVIAPSVYAGLEKTAPQTRWTNGDFTPRNLIIDPSGHPRLIDYEFAARTHFFAEDMWRWRTFSSVPISAGAASDPSAESEAPPWLEMFFWSKQLLLSHHTILPDLAAEDAAHSIRQVTELARGSIPSFSSSHFLHALSAPTHRDETLNALQNEARELRDKIERMQNSRSWRLTAWLRAIRRRFHC